MNPTTSTRDNGWQSYPAEVWDRAHPTIDVQTHLFWMHCLRKHGGPVLDLCCGNGRYAIAIAEAGYEVVGVDINAGLVAIARGRADESRRRVHDLRVTFHVGDVCSMSLGRRFALAIMPMWSFQVFLTQEDQISALRQIREHLSPGGGFAFNLFIPFHRQQGLRRDGKEWKWPRNPRYHHGAPRTYDPATQVETLVETHVRPIRLRHTSLAELELLFRLTGFALTERYGDVDMRPSTGEPDNDYTLLVGV
jgi:SAM-dependent methyltransferase